MIPANKIPVSRQQVENSIKLLEAKIELREKYLHRLKVKAAMERDAIREVMALQIGPNLQLPAVERYLAAQKSFTEAQAAIEEIFLSELRSQKAIQEAMLEQGSKVIVPAREM